MSNILLCATDAGGVRNLIALLPEVARRGEKITFVTRQSLLHLFPLGAPGHYLFAEDLEGSNEQTFESIAPSAVICGTTRHPSLDRDLLSYAGLAGVPCVAVVDEWYNYRYRFSASREHGRPCWPAAIALPDEQAVREGVAEGLPAELCHATGSPSLAEIWDRGKRWQVSPPPVPFDPEGIAERTIVTFLSETHALDYGSQPGQSGLMGAYIGYTEFTVRDLILDMLSGIPKSFVFIEKPHPSAQEPRRPSLVPANVEYRLMRDVATFELCFHSDAVIGMRSMALLEACLLGCKVVSFQPGLAGVERCTAVRLGMVPGLRAPSELHDWLLCAMQGRGAHDLLERPFFARTAAADRVVELALGRKTI